MTEQLISKKDLLLESNISYGQLYRWKRKNLIPDDWFIRKSTFTGQETFFPREKILERIEKIQEMKDNLSLDDLANMFSHSGESYEYNKDEIFHNGFASQVVINLYLEETKFQESVFQFHELLTIYLTDTLLKDGIISLEEGRMIIQLLHSYFKEHQALEVQFVLMRKLGVSSCFIAPTTDSIHFETSTKIITSIDLRQATEQLKLLFV